MSLEENIIKHIHELPESGKVEVLDFIEYLQSKADKKERKNWSNFSLSSAMRGMEEVQTPYSLKDLKESF